MKLEWPIDARHAAFQGELAMTYDRWKTADDTPEDEPTAEDTELQAVYTELAAALRDLDRLYSDRDALLAAAKASIVLADRNVMIIGDDGVPKPCRTPECQEVYDLVAASIAKAEEPMP